jgi:hypothetical protein
MIQNEMIIPLASILLTITALILLLVHEWRISLIVLALQYISVFTLVLAYWPMAMAATKLIAGWISAAVIGMAISSNSDIQTQLNAASSQKDVDGVGMHSNNSSALGLAFRILTAGLVALTAASQLDLITTWFSEMTPLYAWAGVVLIGFGLVKLGFTFQPFHILLALLTSLSGFEILYAAMESSVISAGLFAAVNLALALVGAYLLTAPIMEEEA